MRNINTPREIGIPNPMAYQLLCSCISEYWPNILQHFQRMTRGQRHTVSRIHIRKMGDTNALFVMNYKNWKTDGSPEPDLLIGSKYVVHADVSMCFPSIYTHSIPWALVGKDVSKSHVGNKWKNEWYNKLDHYTQNCKNGETHGVLIGPHAFNVLSEIILTAVDKELFGKWKYCRDIDDYTCYVESREEAQRFLIDLAEALRNYDLALNHKKTEIAELPIAMTEKWTRQIGNPNQYYNKGVLDYLGVRAYLDSAVEIMQKSKENSAILNYAIKALPEKEISRNAIDYCIKTIMHLTLLYPYLLQIIDENVFVRYKVSVIHIQRFARLVYNQELKNKNYDGVCYALFFALKYNFTIDSVFAKDAIDSNSCLFRLLAFLYFKKNGVSAERASLRQLAISLKKNEEDFGRNWLFVYEVLSKSDLSGEWKELKENNVSFLKKEYMF